MRHVPCVPRALAAAATLAALSLASESPATTRDFINQGLERYSDMNHRDPDVRRGSGFMPFHRYADFVGSRMADFENDLPANIRWDRHESLLERERTGGRTGETWFNIGPSNFSGRILAIEVDPSNSNTVYAGSASGGIWKSLDSGVNWVPLDDLLPTLAISAIEIDTSNPQHLYIGTGEGFGNVDAVGGVGVLESFDGGATWNATGLSYDLANGANINELEYNPTTGTLLCGLNGGLKRSTDSGATWTDIYAFGRWTDIELKRGSTSIVFASSFSWSDFGFYRSLDDGATWTRITNGTPAALVNNNRFALTNADPELIYWAINHTANSMSVYKSTDGGDSFAQAFAGNHYGEQGWYDLSLDVSQTDPNMVFSGGVQFYRSTNGAGTFSNWSNGMHVDHHATAWDPSNSSRFWVGSDGGVYLSTNGGTSYSARNTGLITCQFYAMGQSDIQPTRALAGTQDNGTWRYDNSTNWVNILGGDGFQCEADYTNANVLYAELYYGEHYRTDNGGTTIFPRNSGITDAGPWETPTWMDPVNPSILYAAHSTKIWKTTNKGNNWASTTVTGVGGGRAIHIPLTDPNIVGVLSGSRLWLSTDAGATWLNRSTGLVVANSLSAIRFQHDDPNTIIVGVKTYSTSIPQLYKSTDQGVSWFASDANFPDEPVNALEIDPSNPTTYFAATDLAVYVSFDAGATWSPFNTGLPHVVCEDMRLHDEGRFLRLATHGRGMWEVDISTLQTTSVGEASAISPLMMRVFGNPTSALTTLHFGLRKAGQVSLGIYDAQGRRIRALRDAWMPVMVDDVEVDLSDLPGGVYFARLDQGDASITRKIVLEK